MGRKPTPLAMRKVGGPPRSLSPAPIRRIDRRYLVPLPLLISFARRRIEATTSDVSHGGMFALTDEELGLGQLVRVELLLPPRGEMFEGSARLVHRLPVVTRDARPGVGLQHYGLGRELQARWDAFIDHLRRNYPDAEARMLTSSGAEPVEVAFRRNERQLGALRVQVRSVKDLVTMLERDLTRGSIFFATDSSARLHDELALQIVHPDSGHVFELSGRVDRAVQDGNLRGLRFELLDCGPERRQRFEEFVYDGMAELFDDEEVL
jgi:Tfp pilus assembly protein PilZ